MLMSLTKATSPWFSLRHNRAPALPAYGSFTVQKFVFSPLQFLQIVAGLLPGDERGGYCEREEIVREREIARGRWVGKGREGRE